ncbi:unnamed protein product [Menidia menidia]|uniref:(Atlantic silverside) hypothetical protein n=1 Tax=Menidia menidia TaxID=238744 RepID=A0A8S4ANG4_9TELE|nr:unnamed protein product [Menidia menidia]
MLPPKDPITTQGTPPKPRGTSKKNRGRSTGNDQKSKKCHKDSHAPLKASQRSGGVETVAHVRDPSVQARESLRWEGVLQDPLEEAKRLEQYRANRRQRYIAHREALSTETRQTMR